VYEKFSVSSMRRVSSACAAGAFTIVIGDQLSASIAGAIISVIVAA
jgi:hypothetical protein